MQINAEKMSKSLGNFFTIRDILEKFHPEVLRYFLLTMHYRSPLNFSFEAMEEAEKGVRRIYATLAQIKLELERSKWSNMELPDEMITEYQGYRAQWALSMEDDLNTAAALGHIFGAMRLAGRIAEDKQLKKSQGAKNLWALLLEDMTRWAQVLGVFEREPSEFLQELRSSRAMRKDIDVDKVEALLTARQEARKAKDFDKADAVRAELSTLGVEVKDTPNGADWDVG